MRYLAALLLWATPLAAVEVLPVRITEMMPDRTFSTQILDQALGECAISSEIVEQMLVEDMAERGFVHTGAIEESEMADGILTVAIVASPEIGGGCFGTISIKLMTNFTKYLADAAYGGNLTAIEAKFPLRHYEPTLITFMQARDNFLALVEKDQVFGFFRAYAPIRTKD